MTRTFRLATASLLATSGLIMPHQALAASPAPQFTAIDDHGVDMVLGLPYLTIDEGGIGSGPGALRMQRIYAAGAGFLDNWSGGIYPLGGKMIVQINGISDTFSGSGSTWTSDKGDGATLTVDANGYWFYTARDGTIVKFDATRSNFTNYTFASNSCPGADPETCQVPLSIIKPNGLTFTYAWGSGMVCEDIPGEPCATVHRFARLRSVTSSAGYSFAVTYADDVNKGTDAWFTRSGITFSNSVNPPSPAPSIAYGYPSATVTTITDAENRTWTVTTDANGRLIGVRRPVGTTDQIAYAYGTNGMVSSSTKDGVTNGYDVPATNQYRSKDPLLHETIVTNNPAYGRPASVKDAHGDTVSYTYDSKGRVQRITQPELNYAEYAYDTRGNVQSVTNVAKPNAGLANIVTSAAYPASCANAKTCNQPVTTTDAMGSVTNYDYDAGHGGVLSVKSPAPATGADRPETRYHYASVTAASGASVLLLDEVKACPAGVTCSTDKEVRQKVIYNSNLLPITVTRGSTDGSVSATTGIKYDANGHVDEVDGPLTGTADTSKYVHDLMGQLTGIISPDPDGTGGNPMRAVRSTYRGDGQISKRELGTVTARTEAALTNMSALQTVDVGYDGNARPTSQKLSAGGTVYALTQTSYDADGRLQCSAIRMTVTGTQPAVCTPGTPSASGPDQITKLAYDEVDRVTSRTIGFGTPAAAVERALTYSANGQLATLTDGENNRTTYEYDGFDRLSKTRFPVAAKGANASSANDYEQLLGYDANGNPGTRQLRDGITIGYSYDKLNRVKTKDLPGTEPDVTYAWDNLGRLTDASQTGNALSFSYDALSRLKTQSGPLGTVSSDYDAAGRRILLTYPSGGTPLSVNYDYLVTGEINKIRENNATTGVGVLASYSYDVLGNMTLKKFGNGVSQAYTFDPVSRLKTLSNTLTDSGNNLTVGDAQNPIGYNAASQITSVVRTGDAYPFTAFANLDRNYVANGLNQYSSSTAGGPPATFTHDARANMTSDGSSTFTYSSENLLKTGPNSSTLAYDPLLRLSELASGATKTRFGYDGLDMITEHDGLNALLRRHVFAPGLDQPIVTYEGSDLTNRRFLSADERGSIVSVSDNAGAAIATNGYDEYGTPQSPASASAGSAGLGLVAGRFGYTGQAWLPEIGLYHYKARMYSPALGRFLQTDPIGYADQANLYGYVKGDPINLRDPSGKAVGVDNVVGGLFAVGVDVGIQYWTTGKVDTSWQGLGRLGVDFGIGFGTSGISGASNLYRFSVGTRMVANGGIAAAGSVVQTSAHSLLGKPASLGDYGSNALMAFGLGMGGSIASDFISSVALGGAFFENAMNGVYIVDSLGQAWLVADSKLATAADIMAALGSSSGEILITVEDDDGNKKKIKIKKN